MKNKKKLVFLIPFLFIMFLGISYAAFTYVKSIGNNEFIMGDLRINYYDQSPNIKLTHLMPETKEEARDPSLHPTSSITFEGIDYIHQDNELIFSIDSISNLSNFYYSIGIKEGDSIEDKIRLNPKFLRLDLYKINVYTHEETQLLDNYQPINNPLEEMLYVDATSNETILYRIRFWVDDNIIISNSLEYRDITANDFSNGYYSIKVNVNADFDQHFMDKTYMKRYSNEEFWSPEVKAVLSTIDDVKFLHGTDELIEESFDQNVEIRYDATNYNYQTINSLNINPISVFVRTKNNRDELIVVSKSDIVLPEDCSGFLSDSGVVNLYTENFNTNLTTNMSNMFANANKLQTFGYDGEITFDTSNATNMLNMFKGTKLSIETYQNLINNMNTKNVTNMEGMFAGISTNGEINLNKLNTSNVTTMKDMFNHNSFTNIILDEFDTSKVTTMEGMFKDTSKINTINMNKLNTSNVTTMKDMFWGSNITSIDLSNLNLSNITTMYAMFYGCYELTSAQMTYQKTPEMTSNGISYMFKNCTKLVDVSLGGITTSKCNDFQYMFSGCSKIEVIDLSNFDNSRIVNMEGMFLNCTSLKTIYISDLWNNQKMLNYSGNPYQPFTGCASLVGVIPYDSTLNTMKQANSETGYFTLKRQTVGIKPLYKYISSLNGVKSLEITLNKNYSKSYYVDDLSLNHNENANLYVIGDKAYLNLTKRITLQEDITNLFRGLSTVKRISGLNNFDFTNVTNVSHMFDGDTSLINVDTVNIKATNLTNTSYMFNNCNSLVELNISNLDLYHDPNRMDNINYMFADCTNLETIYSDGFSSNYTSGSMDNYLYALKNCHKLRNGTFHNQTLGVFIDSMGYENLGTPNKLSITDGTGFLWTTAFLAAMLEDGTDIPKDPSEIDYTRRSVETGQVGKYLLYKYPEGIDPEEYYEEHGVDLQPETMNLFYRGNDTSKTVLFNNKCWKVLNLNMNVDMNLFEVNAYTKLIYYGKPVLDDNGNLTCPTSNRIHNRNTIGYVNDSTTTKVQYSTSMGTNQIGYMHGSLNDTYLHATSNDIESPVKEALEDWYEEEQFDNYAYWIYDAPYCSDRTIQNDATSTKGFNNVDTVYGSYARNDSLTESNPILSCPRVEDTFTVSPTKGNGKNNHPIGLITADEAVMAGTILDFLYSNTNDILFYNGYSSDCKWTMTPYSMYNGQSKMIKYSQYNGLSSTATTTSCALQPVISLNLLRLYILSGDGSPERPYIFNMNEEKEEDLSFLF